MVIFFSSVISAVAFIASPIFVGKTIDHIAEGVRTAVSTSTSFQVNLQTMGGLVQILLALYLLSFAADYLGQYLMASVSETTSLNMRKALSEKLHQLPLRFYDSVEKGEVLSRATNDIEKVAESLREGLLRLISSSIMIIGSVIMMLFISPDLSLVAVMMLCIAAFALTAITKRTRRHFSNYQSSLGRLNANIEEAFTGQLIIKAFNHEDKSLKEFRKINDKLYTDSYRSQIAQYMMEPSVRVINSLGYITIVVLSGISIIHGRLSIGTAIAFIQYLDKAFEPTTEFAQIMNAMQSAMAASQRFFQLMDELNEMQDTASPKKIAAPKGEVAFHHVRFGYRDDEILMQDINIHLNAGDKVAIVGPTGAGKTTLVNLLMRFYEIQGGRITIDGIDVKEISRADLRSMFGMVLQDTWLFGGSIRDNISYGNFNAGKEVIVAAAKSARVDHFIRTMPNGYDTILTEDGANLSQGQKQLLTIARAILANPTILILDEATSSVDTRTETEIQRALNNLMKGRTSFIIAHKLSTIRDADLILVMNDGTVIEQGTHSELLHRKGLYESLYNSQFA